MTAICIRCGKIISDVYLICTECATNLFGENIFWIASSPIIGEPVLDRYREDSEPILTIGERPGSELEFTAGFTTMEEVKNLFLNDEKDMDEIQSALNKILAELGIPRDIDFKKYIYSPSDIDVFAEIFYSLEELKKQAGEFKELPDLYLRIANLFFYTAECADISAFEPVFRQKVVNDLLDESQICYQISISNSDDDYVHYRNMGFLYLRRRVYDESKKHFRKAIELNEKDVESYIGLARLLIEEEGYPKADKILDKIISLDRNDPRVWFIKGELTRLKGRWGGAIQLYNQTLKRDKSHIDAVLMKGRVLFKREMFDEANIIFNQMINEDDSDPRGWYWKGMTMHSMGKWGGALQCVNEALSIDSQMADAWKLKGDILMERKVFEEARLAYNNALEIKPKSKLVQDRKKKCEAHLY